MYRKQTQEISTRNVRMRRPEVKHPLQEYGMSHLMQLEKSLLENKFDLHSIQELIKIYTSFVEYYDSKQDPTMMYFMEKIQLLLSNEKALEAIKRVSHALGAGILSGHLGGGKKDNPLISITKPKAPVKELAKPDVKLDKVGDLSSLSPDQAQYSPHKFIG